MITNMTQVDALLNRLNTTGAMPTKPAERTEKTLEEALTSLYSKRNMKSRVMQKAWAFFKQLGLSFSESLKLSWKQEKEVFFK